MKDNKSPVPKDIVQAAIEKFPATKYWNKCDYEWDYHSNERNAYIKGRMDERVVNVPTPDSTVEEKAESIYPLSADSDTQTDILQINCRGAYKNGYQQCLKDSIGKEYTEEEVLGLLKKMWVEVAEVQYLSIPKWMQDKIEEYKSK